ncbi:hypothetical protein [Hoeflea sp.]|uniref:hypothetical protein n=1 Tax=Hoeflea sp. TaxID=1940281 RepID=UPI003749BFBA
MSVTGYTPHLQASGYAPEEQLPGVFIGFASLGFVLVLLSIVLSVYLSPVENPGFHFGGDGLNTALLVICMSMTACASGLVFYIRSKDFTFGALFWLVLAAAAVVISLNAQLHLGASGFEIPAGWSATFLVYSLGVVAMFMLFSRELRSSRTFLTLLAAAIAFLFIHACIDGLVSGFYLWKDVLGEGSSLIAAFLLLLATSARLVLLIEQLQRRRRFG